MNDKKILIIDDDAYVAAGLEAALSLKGWETEHRSDCQSLEEMLTYIRMKRPDIIILDVIQPYLDGFKLLSEIKADDALNHIVMIIYSDFSEADLKMRCHNSGADYFFIKEEINPTDFSEKILKIFKNKGLL